MMGIINVMNDSAVPTVFTNTCFMIINVSKDSDEFFGILRLFFWNSRECMPRRLLHV